eukprot:m.95061 g.95061  ORF g.95061 m.95061 type:complete len:540 (-) comp15438_c0_seq2:328-1947(-)
MPSALVCVGLALLLAFALPASATLPQVFNLAQSGTLGNSSSLCSKGVLSQGMCGSCYAFTSSTVFGMSSCAVATGNAKDPLTLSPQFTLGMIYEEVYKAAGQSPCGGGDIAQTLWYLSQESQYGSCDTTACETGCLPYTESNCVIDSNGVATNCKAFSTACVTGSTFQSSAPPMNVMYVAGSWDTGLANFKTEVKEWLVNNGPVGIAIDACDGWVDYFVNYNTYLQQYQSYFKQQKWPYNPVLPFPSTCNNSDTDHAVTIVGWYDVVVDKTGDTYWIVQNSWGNDLGDAGFFYISHNAQMQGPAANGYVTVNSMVGVTSANIFARRSADSESSSESSSSSTPKVYTPASVGPSQPPVMGAWRDVEVQSASLADSVSQYVTARQQEDEANGVLPSDPHGVAAVLDGVLSSLREMDAALAASVVVGAQKKTVAGTLFNITTQQHSSGETLQHSIVVMRHPLPASAPASERYQLLQVQTQVVPSSSTKAGLIAGLTVGLVALAGCVAAAAYVVHKKRVAAAAPARYLSEPLMMDDNLAADDE